MQRIRYIKMLLVIGVMAAIGLCALLLITQANQREPSNGAKLIIERGAEISCI